MSTVDALIRRAEDASTRRSPSDRRDDEGSGEAFARSLAETKRREAATALHAGGTPLPAAAAQSRTDRGPTDTSGKFGSPSPTEQSRLAFAGRGADPSAPTRAERKDSQARQAITDDNGSTRSSAHGAAKSSSEEAEATSPSNTTAKAESKSTDGTHSPSAMATAANAGSAATTAAATAEITTAADAVRTLSAPVDTISTATVGAAANAEVKVQPTTGASAAQAAPAEADPSATPPVHLHDSGEASSESSDEGDGQSNPTNNSATADTKAPQPGTNTFAQVFDTRALPGAAPVAPTSAPSATSLSASIIAASADDAMTAEFGNERARLSAGGTRARIVIGTGEDRIALIVSMNRERVEIRAQTANAHLAQQLEGGSAELGQALRRHGLELLGLSARSDDGGTADSRDSHASHEQPHQEKGDAPVLGARRSNPTDETQPLRRPGVRVVA